LNSPGGNAGLPRVPKLPNIAKFKKPNLPLVPYHPISRSSDFRSVSSAQISGKQVLMLFIRAISGSGPPDHPITRDHQITRFPISVISANQR
jgi:hypothetical protein